MGDGGGATLLVYVCQLDMKVLFGTGRASSFSAVLASSSELRRIERDGSS